MSLKKIFGKLETIAFLGRTIAFLGILGLTSRAIGYDYGYNREYKFKIGKDYVIFLHHPDDINNPYDDPENIIDIIKPNGTVISLRDSRGNDSEIEEVVIYQDGESRHYFSGEKLDRKIIKKGQKKFDEYFKKIHKAALRENSKILK